MAIFSTEEYDQGELGYRLMEDSSVNLYYRKEVIDKDMEWLKEKGYEIISFDCLSWKDKEEFYKEFSEKMSFPPDIPAHNLDALDDWMGDIEFKGDGKVMVFLNFDHLLKNIEERLALCLLNIFENHSRRNLMFGNRLITLLQTGDPAIAIEEIGATFAKWNHDEQSYKSRGITDVKTYTRLKIKGDSHHSLDY